MAIAKNGLFRKVSGSVGGTTANMLKGQQVIKEKVAKKGSILPANFSLAQIQMSNVVMLWQFLALFLSKALYIRKATESVYNAFVRLSVGLTSADLYTDTIDAVGNFGGTTIGSGKWVTMNSATVTATIPTIDFITNGIPWVATRRMRYMGVNGTTLATEIRDVAISEAQWNAKTLVGAAFPAGMVAVMVYIYDAQARKISDIKF